MSILSAMNTDVTFKNLTLTGSLNLPSDTLTLEDLIVTSNVNTSTLNCTVSAYFNGSISVTDIGIANTNTQTLVCVNGTTLNTLECSGTATFSGDLTCNQNITAYDLDVTDVATCNIIQSASINCSGITTTENVTCNSTITTYNLDVTNIATCENITCNQNITTEGIVSNGNLFKSSYLINPVQYVIYQGDSNTWTLSANQLSYDTNIIGQTDYGANLYIVLDECPSDNITLTIISQIAGNYVMTVQNETGFDFYGAIGSGNTTIALANNDFVVLKSLNGLWYVITIST